MKRNEHELVIKAYFPLWFEIYSVLLFEFSRLTGVDVDYFKYEELANKAIKIKVVK